MAAYSYKDVMYRDDFQAAVKPCMESLGFTESDFNGEANYDGDGWTVAAFLLEQKDAEIMRLRAAVAPLAALKVPAKPQGNAGAYSIRHSDIEAAKAALGQ